MSSLRVTSLRGRTAGSAPTLPDGAVITGIATATTFDGNVTGNATGISGTPNITVGFLTATGNVSIAGTLVYDDVTRIDSVGIVTAGGGLYVGRTEGTGTGIAVTVTTDGNAIFGKTGVVTATTFVGNVTGNASGTAGGLSGTPNITVGTVVGSALTVSGITTVTNFETQGTLIEAFKTHTTAWNSAGNLNLSEGNLHYNSTNLGGTGAFLNLISTAGINTDLATGQALNVTAITAVNATTAFVNALKIDGKGTGITTSWVGGSVPTDGGGSAYDTYSFNILKTASETYIVIANQVKTS